MKKAGLKAAAAFAAAGLMILVSAAPVCAEEADTASQTEAQGEYYEYDENGLPVWNKDMCIKQVDEQDIQAGRYYISYTTKCHFNILAPTYYDEIYTLVKVDRIWYFNAVWPFSPYRLARIINPLTQTREIVKLEDVCYYEIPCSIPGSEKA